MSNFRDILSYGGMPQDVLTRKFEETDPKYLPNDPERGYDKYVRSEIVDWGPDVSFLESDQPKRDPLLSRSMLSLRHNGTRGMEYPRGPIHPDLFYGFMGNDPRGTTNDPRFDKARGFMESRAEGREFRMGKNDDNHLSERPWTGQSISHAMKKVHRVLKDKTRVFSAQKDGRIMNNNTITKFRNKSKFRSTDSEAFSENVSNTTHGVGADAGMHVKAPWRHTIGSEQNLGIQQYGKTRGVGHNLTKLVGGKLVETQGTEHDWIESKIAHGNNRKVLAATMATASRFRRVVESTKQEQAHGKSYESFNEGRQLNQSKDVSSLYRHIVGDQYSLTAGKASFIDNTISKGLIPSAHPENAVKSIERASVTDNEHLTNIDAIVTGLRIGTAASRRKIASAVVADGFAKNIAIMGESTNTKGIIPTSNFRRAMSEMPIIRGATSEGLEVHVYSGNNMPKKPEERVALASYDETTWKKSQELLTLGLSKTPDGNHKYSKSIAGVVPNYISSEITATGGASQIGAKNLRAGNWSNDVEFNTDFDTQN